MVSIQAYRGQRVDQDNRSRLGGRFMSNKVEKKSHKPPNARFPQTPQAPVHFDDLTVSLEVAQDKLYFCLLHNGKPLINLIPSRTIDKKRARMHIWTLFAVRPLFFNFLPIRNLIFRVNEQAKKSKYIFKEIALPFFKS